MFEPDPAFGNERELDLDWVVDEIQRRVRVRRQRGDYPPGLEAELDRHFESIKLATRRWTRDGANTDLTAALDRLDAASGFSADKISTASSRAAGAAVHRAVERAVRRQVEGILAQNQTFADVVRDVLRQLVRQFDERVVPTVEGIHIEVGNVVDQLVEGRLEMERRIDELERRLDGERGGTLSEWFSSERFEDRFRGTEDDLKARLADLADRLAVGGGPVIDVGFGRGELLQLLAERGVEARGVEIDPDLVDAGRSRGLEVTVADAVEHLRAQGDATLGGIAAIQVVEHLPPVVLAEMVAVAAQKLRPGGVLVAETVNPQSLYVYAHAFFVDPTHTSPVHPAYLEFLCREAGFATVEIDWRSEPPEDERLQKVGSDAVLDANIERLNRLLFGPQDYAVIATR